jgi:hypothetical protein
MYGRLLTGRLLSNIDPPPVKTGDFLFYLYYWYPARKIVWCYDGITPGISPGMAGCEV